jgi:hypothetical protein
MDFEDASELVSEVDAREHGDRATRLVELRDLLGDDPVGFSAENARDAIVLEFPREERAMNGPERDASRPPRPAVPALTCGVTSGASKNRTYDLILIRDAL